jgi:hypothetical protein
VIVSPTKRPGAAMTYSCATVALPYRCCDSTHQSTTDRF